jgi:hypothetical protein
MSRAVTEKMARSYTARADYDREAALLAVDGWIVQSTKLMPPRNATKRYLQGRWLRGWTHAGEPPESEIVVTYTRRLSHRG